MDNLKLFHIIVLTAVVKWGYSSDAACTKPNAPSQYTVLEFTHTHHQHKNLTASAHFHYANTMADWPISVFPSSSVTQSNGIGSANQHANC